MYRTEDAVSGGARGVPATAVGRGSTEDVRCSCPDDAHVRWRGPDVRAGRIAPAECGYRVSDVEHDVAAVRSCWRRTMRYGDHRLAAAVVEVGQRAFLGHRSSQPLGIGEALAPAAVRLHPAAPERLTERDRVDHDSDRQAAAGAGRHVHLRRPRDRWGRFGLDCAVRLHGGSTAQRALWRRTVRTSFGRKPRRRRWTN